MRHKPPEATEVCSRRKKSPVSYIHIASLRWRCSRSSVRPRIQFNDSSYKTTKDIPDFVVPRGDEREALSSRPERAARRATDGTGTPAAHPWRKRRGAQRRRCDRLAGAPVDIDEHRDGKQQREDGDERLVTVRRKSSTANGSRG